MNHDNFAAKPVIARRKIKQAPKKLEFVDSDDDFAAQAPSYAAPVA